MYQPSIPVTDMGLAIENPPPAKSGLTGLAFSWKEFKRRTKPMEIVAGEESVYRILAFVAMKMEVSWRNAPFRNSGFRKLKPFAGYFTHESLHYHGEAARWAIRNPGTVTLARDLK